MKVNESAVPLAVSTSARGWQRATFQSERALAVLNESERRVVVVWCDVCMRACLSDWYWS